MFRVRCNIAGKQQQMLTNRESSYLLFAFTRWSHSYQITGSDHCCLVELRPLYHLAVPDCDRQWYNGVFV